MGQEFWVIGKEGGEIDEGMESMLGSLGMEAWVGKRVEIVGISNSKVFSDSYEYVFDYVLCAFRPVIIGGDNLGMF